MDRPNRPKAAAASLLFACGKVYIWPIISQDTFMTLLRFFTAFLLTLVFAAPVAAQDRRVPSSAAELRLSYAPIVQRVQPAVVNVYAAKTARNRKPPLDDAIFRRFVGV